MTEIRRFLARLDFFLPVLRARTNTSRGAASPHFAVYSFVPDILSTHPFLGLGLNNFAVYYEFVTGRPDFGPHSFYVATIVETGIVGATLFGVFVVWLFRRLGAARRIGRALSVAGDPLAGRSDRLSKSHFVESALLRSLRKSRKPAPRCRQPVRGRQRLPASAGAQSSPGGHTQ